jgi:multidrug efflux pump subunit AcrA (membrane-fusion protein)
MDRRIEKKTWTGKRVSILLGLVALAAGVAALLSYFSTPRMQVERDKLSLDTVRRGTFQEYILPEGTLLREGESLIVRAAVDAFEAPRLRAGQRGEVEAGGILHPLEVTRIGPAGPRSADVDLRFTGPVPETLAPGQRIRVRLNLGAPAEALLLRRGAFFQETGGHWVFVLDAAGDTAVRRPVRLGRQNPEVHEVLSGLAPGDRVIISTYGHLVEAEELVLTGN